jgi:Ca-activated chloride channel homolog
MPSRSLFHFGVALILAVPTTGLAENFASPATFRVAADLVLVPVTVIDRNGKTVQGLEAHNFTILDNLEPQRIVSFANEDSPCSVGLVLDVSGSMRYTLEGAKEIARAFLGTANPDDEFQLLTVSSQPQAISGFTTDVPALEASIGSSRSGGMTALFDTVYVAEHRMREAKRPRRALLIVSDGIDNHSRYSQRALMQAALEADVQVYTILVANGSAAALGDTATLRPILVRKPWEQTQERQGPSTLEALSAKTGGLFFRVADQAEAKRAAIQAGQAIRGEYLIGYQAPESVPAGKWHRVRVHLDIPHVEVHGRKGYYSR